MEYKFIKAFVWVSVFEAAYDFFHLSFLSPVGEAAHIFYRRFISIFFCRYIVTDFFVFCKREESGK